MRNYTLLVLLFFMLTFSAAFAGEANPDKKKSDESASGISVPIYPDGIIYALPRTGFIINISTKRTTFKPGPYSQYAQKYLGITNAVGTEKSVWEITGINISPFAEADPQATFKLTDTLALPVSLTSDGVIADINGNGVQSCLQIIGNDFFVKKEQSDNLFTDLSSNDFYELMVDPATGAESMKLKSLETKAREAADYLIRLRKKRAFAIIDPSDAIPEDGHGYEVFVNEALRLEKEYTALFVGRRIVTEQAFSFVFVPGSSNVKNEVLFRFSDERGVLPKTDISGKPILIALTKDDEAFVSCNKLKESQNPKAGSKGIYYRIPIGASIIVSDGLQSLYIGQTTVAQFGVVAPVPENLLKGGYAINYNIQTGTIKNIVEAK